MYTQVINPIEMELTEKSKLIFSASKNNKTDEVYVDIRIHVNSERYSGPTKKGITFPLDRIEEVQEKLKELDNMLIAKGY